MTKPSYEELEWPAPQAANESDDDFFLRILREHRQSHADWIPHLEKHAPENEHTRRALGNADIQRADVRRYDKLIGIFEWKCAENLRVRGLLQRQSDVLQRIASWDFDFYGDCVAEAKKLASDALSQADGE